MSDSQTETDVNYQLCSNLKEIIRLRNLNEADVLTRFREKYKNNPPHAADKGIVWLTCNDFSDLLGIAKT